MKNLRLTTLLIALFGTFLFTACSDDDKDDKKGKTPMASNSISLDGKNYNLISGIIFDYGPSSADYNSPATHYNYDLYTTDGTLTLVQDSADEHYEFSKNTTILISLELYSPDTVTFKSGTFNYINEDSISRATTKGKYYFSYGEVELDDDGIIVNDDFDGPEYEVVGGSVVLSGTSTSNYSISYNLLLEGGKTLSGTYSGPFIYENDM